MRTQGMESAQFDRPWVAGLLVLLLYTVFVAGMLAAQDWDPSTFIQAGDAFANPEAVPDHLHVIPNSMGYDGQFYYRLALKPFSRQRTAFGLTLDMPSYRQQRLLYPLLAHLLAFGKVAWVPWSLIAINLFALGMAGFMAGRLSQALGRHALWGLSVVLYGGLAISLFLDLVEIVEICFLLGALDSLVRGHRIQAAVLLCLAMLAKETALGLALGAAVSVGWDLLHRRCPKDWLLFVLPWATYFLLQSWLTIRWPQPGLTRSAISANVGFHITPAYFLYYSLRNPSPLRIFEVMELLGVFSVFGLAAVVRRSELPRSANIAWLGYACLALVMRHYAGGDWAYLRALSELYVLSMLRLIGQRKSLSKAVGISAVGFWLLSIAGHVVMRLLPAGLGSFVR